MKIDDASLLAYVDGELTPQENARIEEAIAASEELASRVAMLRASQLPYGEAFDQQSLPPVPESLTRSVDELIRRHLAGEGASVAAPQATAPAANADDEDSEASLGPNVHRLKPRTRSLPSFSWPKLAVAFVAGSLLLRLGPAVRAAPVGRRLAHRLERFRHDALDQGRGRLPAALFARHRRGAAARHGRHRHHRRRYP
ncbi:anti-sigma factor family protein [Burkholderia gladioli]|uniref:anti-sigma factor family protein n=1 Tax=Burkholderia gladioli TaxID=28095 RepID=UPI001FC842E1|nr:hypothetical protein [Burkholderia gladioli]